MDQKFCKKCGKPLPDDYKHNKCERCRSKNAENGVFIVGIAGALAAVGFVVKEFAKAIFKRG